MRNVSLLLERLKEEKYQLNDDFYTNICDKDEIAVEFKGYSKCQIELMRQETTKTGLEMEKTHQ